MFAKLVRIGCSFPACHSGSAKYQTCLIFHPPPPPESIFGPWFCSPGSRPVVGLYGLLDTLPVLSCTVAILSGSISWPIMVKYLNTTS